MFGCVHISGSEVGNSNESSMNVGAIILYAKNLPFALSTTSFLDSQRARIALGGRVVAVVVVVHPQSKCILLLHKARRCGC